MGGVSSKDPSIEADNRGLSGFFNDIEAANKLAACFRHESSQLFFVCMSSTKSLNEFNFRVRGKVGVKRVRLNAEEAIDAATMASRCRESCKVLTYLQFVKVLRRMQTDAEVAMQIQIALRGGTAPCMAPERVLLDGGRIVSMAEARGLGIAAPARARPAPADEVCGADAREAGGAAGGASEASPVSVAATAMHMMAAAAAARAGGPPRGLELPPCAEAAPAASAEDEEKEEEEEEEEEEGEERAEEGAAEQEEEVAGEATCADDTEGEVGEEEEEEEEGTSRVGRAGQWGDADAGGDAGDAAPPADPPARCTDAAGGGGASGADGAVRGRAAKRGAGRARAEEVPGGVEAGGRAAAAGGAAEEGVAGDGAEPGGCRGPLQGSCGGDVEGSCGGDVEGREVVRRTEYECMICLQMTSSGIALPCFHGPFCEGCISVWSRQNRSCPACRMKTGYDDDNCWVLLEEPSLHELVEGLYNYIRRL